MKSPCISMVGIWLIAATAHGSDGARRVEGRVVDEADRPAAGIVVAPFWGANGVDQEGIEAIQKAGKTEDLWRSEGAMMPMGRRVATTDARGRFAVEMEPRGRALLAYDAGRTRGALLAVDPKRPEAALEGKLGPLVRVRGSIRSADSGALPWSLAYLKVPLAADDPLGFDRLAICGTYRNAFEFLIPAGNYRLQASSDEPSSATVESIPLRVEADAAGPAPRELVLHRRPTLQERIDEAKGKGTWGDFKRHFGQEPPPWHLTDARGVARDAKLADFKGRWALLYLWTPNCAPCLGRELPGLMAFYDDHRADRDRFEILAFCSDFGGGLDSVAALEKQLEPVRDHVWGGRSLPFPVLLDNTFQTYERLGLEGAGVSSFLLIDPAGKLVEGGLERLAEALKAPKAPPR